MSDRPNNFSEKLLASIKQGLKQTKDLLSKDYSLQDLKNLKSLPKTLQQKLSGMRLASSKIVTGSAQESEKFAYKQIPNLVATYMTSHRNVVIGFVVLIVALLINAFAISPYSQRVQNQLEMRPAQWSQLQSLIKLAKSTSAVPATVSLLDDTELQKIRSVLTSRGIKLNVLRLTADNPPRIEFQASDVMFSVLLDTLDELRIAWRLYPEQLNVVSAGGAGMVNIGGVLVQYGGQSGAQLSGVSR